MFPLTLSFLSSTWTIGYLKGTPSVLELGMAECVSKDPSAGSLVLQMLGGGRVTESEDPMGGQKVMGPSRS